ncbi:hypothetical protein A4X09_0g6514 [Tilletia walkeri]|uniref:Uncharacterized protein n=1 Tax=Tilletia walkeri TaxID=117179 RepID=A0A8X7T316_9BASI|nr:hypothetical protein A4X09_0g6514 [Tilletia walkeri]
MHPPAYSAVDPSFVWPSVGVSFTQSAAELGVTVDVPDTFDLVDSNQGPSPSQNCLDLLDPQVRLAYKMAYTFAKNAHGAGELPNWSLLYLEVVFTSAPASIQQRMQAHFDQYFQRVQDRLDDGHPAPSESFVRAAPSGSGVPDAAIDEFLGANGRSGGSSGGDERVPDGHVDNHVSPSRQTGLSTSGTLTISPDVSEDEPRVPQHLGPSTPASAMTSSSSTSDLVPAKRTLHRTCTLSFKQRSSLAASSVAGSSTLSNARSRSSNGSPRKNSSSSSLLNRVPTPNNSIPVLSNTARAALLKSGPLYPKWEYRGLIRWAKGGLSEEVPLTFDEVSKESAAPRVGVERFPRLRERWQCRSCGALRHEPVGQTTNLTKHHKNNKCSGSNVD